MGASRPVVSPLDTVFPSADTPGPWRDNRYYDRYIHVVICRYLDSFEKFHFLGEEEEDNENLYYDEEDRRARHQKAQKIIATVPLTYNTHQHNVSGGDAGTPVHRNKTLNRLYSANVTLGGEWTNTLQP